MREEIQPATTARGEGSEPFAVFSLIREESKTWAGSAGSVPARIDEETQPTFLDPKAAPVVPRLLADFGNTQTFATAFDPANAFETRRRPGSTQLLP